MQNWIISIMQQYGYWGVALLIAIENIFPPIPSEVILTFGGFMTTYTSLNIWAVILAATAGSLIGAIVLYGVGYLLPPRRLKGILNGRIGKLLHLYPDDVDKAVEWFNHTGISTVFFCRFIPMVRSLISIPAGFARIHLAPFLLLTTLGSFLWNTVLVWVGVAARESWDIIVKYLASYSGIAKFILFGAACTAVIMFIKKRSLSKNKEQME